MSVFQAVLSQSREEEWVHGDETAGEVTADSLSYGSHAHEGCSKCSLTLSRGSNSLHIQNMASHRQLLPLSPQ